MEPEFTLTLIRQHLGTYTARARFRKPDSEGDLPGQETVYFDLDAFDANRGNADEYGRRLTTAVFRGSVLDCWKAARGTAGPLRVRLELDDTALELHRLRWEALANPAPADGVAAAGLLTDSNVWFSRYLTSREPLRSRPRVTAAVRVLIAVASLKGNPAEFDYEAQLAELRGVWAELTDERNVTVLAGPPADGGASAGRATRANILARLRDGDGYDVLYLVAHGQMDGPEPRVLLENDAGAREGVKGSVFAADLGRLPFPPRLVVLSSCQSAGEDRPTRDTDLDAALGPRIGRAGIPAVVGMFGSVKQETAHRFVTAFFQSLTDGYVDQAAAAARAVVFKERSEYWAPILYTRLTTNRLWVPARPGARPGQPEWWPGLLRLLKSGRCIPVVGGGVLEPVAGPATALAAALLNDDGWADVGRPATLPQAAQYVGTMRKEWPAAYLDALRTTLLNRHPLLGAADLGPAALPQVRPSPYADAAEEDRRLLAAAADRVAATGSPEPHQLLARLPCPVYISTNPDDLLARALAARPGRPGVDVTVCNWLYDPARPGEPTATPPGSPTEQGGEPTVDRPLVCHLFGHLSDPQTLVLTEDEYFRFLVGLAAENYAKKDPNVKMQSAIDQKLNVSGLLFVGFRLDDWNFRAFLAALLSRPAATYRWRFRDLVDVGVQLDPEDGLNADPQRVRRYVEELFGERLFSRSRIHIYWVSTQEFLANLAAAFPA